MTTTAIVPTFIPQPVTRVASTGMHATEALGEQIAALAMQLHAATYELLVLLREFDQRTGWHGGFASCAHWLHWRTGIDLGAAREKVRVAHALAALPLVSATMQRGAISYAKVRALTRVATPANEARLLSSRRPARPRRWSAWSVPGGAWTMPRPRRKPRHGICTGTCLPGPTTTAWW
jgi:hypothetical protein